MTPSSADINWTGGSAELRRSLEVLGLRVIPSDTDSSWSVDIGRPMSEFLRMRHGMTLTDWSRRYELQREALHEAVDWVVEQHKKHNPWEAL